MRVVTGTWSAEAGWSRPPAEFAEAARDGGATTMVLAFADSGLRADPSAIDEIVRLLPAAAVIGCSTAGQILGETISPTPLVVAAVHFDEVRPQAAWASVSEADGTTALGRLLGDRLTARLGGDESGTVFVLADGIVVNGSELVDGLREVVPEGVGISGGLAGDGPRFEDTWVYADGQVRAEAVAAIALTGPALEVSYGLAGGWEAFGPYRLVTESHGNVLHQLDGRPALALYKEYLGDRATQLPASALLFPLSVRAPEGDVELVRTVLGVDEATSTMTFAGDIPEGWTARLMRTTLDRLIDAAGVAAEHASRGEGRNELTIAVSCVGRRLVLGERSDEEVEAASSTLGSSSPLIGFYSYGEISPHSGQSELHNQTMTLTTLGESTAR